MTAPALRRITATVGSCRPSPGATAPSARTSPPMRCGSRGCRRGWLPRREGAGGGFTGAVRFEVILTVEDWTRHRPGPQQEPAQRRQRHHGPQERAPVRLPDDLRVRPRRNTGGALGEPSAPRPRSPRAWPSWGSTSCPYLRCDHADGAVGYFRRDRARRATRCRSGSTAS